MKQLLLMTIVSLSFGLTGASAYAEGHHDQQREMKADTNGDGKVSFEEFKAAHMARIEARFKRKDINQDGFIDASDIKVIKKERRAKKQAQKEEDKKALREKYIEEKRKRKKHFYKY